MVMRPDRYTEQAQAIHRNVFPDSRQGDQAGRILQDILTPRPQRERNC